MSSLRPIADLHTHAVTNQPPPFEDIDLFATDRALADALAKAGGGAHAADWERSAAEPGRPR